MSELFQTESSENLDLYSMENLENDLFEESACPSFIENEPYELSIEGLSDETASLEQSYHSPSVPNSPNGTELTSPQPEPSANAYADQVSACSNGCQTVIFPRYAAAAATTATTQQIADKPIKEEKMPEIKHEVPEPVVRHVPVTSHQPAAKRARTTVSQQSTDGNSSKILDLINTNNMESYIQTLAKGKSEDIELFRNVLRCNGSLTPEAEKQLKHLARQVKNRESAQLSRQRKREFVQTLKSVIDKMRSVDNTLRSDLSNAQTEAAQYKAEAERWQAYACNLQKLLQQNGIEVPSIPEIPAKVNVVPAHEIPQIMIPESLFDGPCGFGHMAPTKCCNKRRTRSRKVKEQKA